MVAIYRTTQQEHPLRTYDLVGYSSIVLRPLNDSVTVQSHSSEQIHSKGKGQVKFTLEQATKAQKGSRGIVLLLP